jgi:hypothetical protein
LVVVDKNVQFFCTFGKIERENMYFLFATTTTIMSGCYYDPDFQYYGNGVFEFVDESSRPMFQNAHWAISECGLWEWFRDFEVDKTRGFMFTVTPEIEKINAKMAEQPEISDLHSGCSYAVTMQNMNFIAKNGYDQFRVKYQNKQN